MAYLLSLQAPKSNDLWDYTYADPAGGLLDEDDLHLAYFEVMLGKVVFPIQGGSFRLPDYLINNRNHWLPYGRH